MSEISLTFVCPRSPLKHYGGAEHHAFEIARRLHDRGYRIEIMATDPNSTHPEKTVSNGLLIRTFPAFAPQDSYDFSPQLYQAIRKTSSDILHVHGFYAFHMPFATLARQKHQRLVLTPHSSASSSALRRIFRKPYHVFCRLILANVDKIVCVSREEYYRFAKSLGLPHHRYTIIPNAADPQEFSDVSEELTLKDPYVLSVGRLEECKGFQYLIGSLGEFHAEHPKLRLIIVGSGPYKQRLIELITKLGLKDRIEIYERVPRRKLTSLYANCTLFALLSRGESSGIAVLDALAARKPVVVTTTYALKEYVERGLALGVNFPPTPEEVFRVVSSIVENPGEYVPRGAGILTWDEVVDRLVLLYKAVREGHGNTNSIGS